MKIASPWLLVLGALLAGLVQGRSSKKTLFLEEAPDDITRHTALGSYYGNGAQVLYTQNATGLGAQVTTAAMANRTTPASVNVTANATSQPKNFTNSTAAAQTASLNATTPEPANRSEGTDGHATTVGEKGSEVRKEPRPRHYFSPWLMWKDSYTSNILIPIICGMTAALLIICTLWCIACCKRRCRSRYRRKVGKQLDPKTIRKLKAADRIKLLAASSDEEF